MFSGWRSLIIKSGLLRGCLPCVRDFIRLGAFSSAVDLVIWSVMVSLVVATRFA